MPKQIIEAGTVIYKKCLTHADDYNSTSAIVSLTVTEPGFIALYEDPEYDSWLSNAENKVRVRAATVLSIERVDGEPLTRAYSLHDPNFEYTVGKEVRPTKPFELEDYACGSGIHGFLTREQAEAY